MEALKKAITNLLKNLKVPKGKALLITMKNDKNNKTEIEIEVIE